ncbi:MAG: hypothetical protein ACYCVO_13355, partial [Acidimicrobiales bacterium]
GGGGAGAPPPAGWAIEGRGLGLELELAAQGGLVARRGLGGRNGHPPILMGRVSRSTRGRPVGGIRQLDLRNTTF